MSVKSAIWVQAHLRRCNASGLAAMLVKRGAEEAGSIYVKVNRLDGSVVLFGPAPGPSHDERGERRWMPVIGTGAVPEPDADAYLRRQRAIDPDIWIIEIEDTGGSGLLHVAGGGLEQ
jgi:hypothetical protein